MDHRAKKSRGRRAETTNTSFLSLVINGALGASVASASALILCAIGSGLSLLFNNPISLSLPIGLTILSIISIIGGMVGAARVKKDKGASYVAAALCGFILIIFFGLISTVLNFTSIGNVHHLNPVISVLLRFVSIPLSLLGAYIILSLNKKRSPKRRRH